MNNKEQDLTVVFQNENQSPSNNNTKTSPENPLRMALTSTPNSADLLPEVKPATEVPVNEKLSRSHQVVKIESEEELEAELQKVQLVPSE